MFRFFTFAFLFLIVLNPHSVFSHGNEEHGDQQTEVKNNSHFDEDGFEIISQGPSPAQLQAINRLYLDRVKPIFQKKCFDCHGSATQYPWYYKLPGVKGMIDDDVTEAKKHMDMSLDFPFQGHGAPVDDLKAIATTVKENSMPPFRYWMIHWKSRLNEDEKKAILKWVEEGQDVLNASNSTGAESK